MTCAVVIPVYKAKPTVVEMASFKQCLTVLKNYDIYIITFKGLDLSVYSEISLSVQKKYKLHFLQRIILLLLLDIIGFVLVYLFMNVFLTMNT